jgi:hypothetical protein
MLPLGYSTVPRRPLYKESVACYNEYARIDFSWDGQGSTKMCRCVHVPCYRWDTAPLRVGPYIREALRDNACEWSQLWW